MHPIPTAPAGEALAAAVSGETPVSPFAMASVAAARGAAGGPAYGEQRLPASLSAARVPPQLQLLTRLLNRHGALTEQLVHLTQIERTMRWPGASFDSLGEPLLVQAVWELRLLARHCSDMAATARLLDLFDGRLARLAAARRAAAPR